MKNRIIFDSGSTKTDIRFLYGEEIIEKQSSGINPFYQDSDDILNSLQKDLGFQQNNESFEIYFYGAGCSFPEKKEVVKAALTEIFPNSSIKIENDLLGAARSLFQNKTGIACILGTGSNSCHFAEDQILKNIPPLGFIIGDEGSGANLGKLLIGDILKGLAPSDVSQRFFSEENCTAEEIMNHIYKEEFPNRYLANFSRHIYKHINEEYFENLVLAAFNAFFERNILQYDASIKEIGFVGSIAHHFAPQLKKIAEKHCYRIEKIVKTPMEGLIDYHRG